MNIAQIAQDYADAFDIPMDEIREWYRGSDDKPGLVEYMAQQVAELRAWRQSVADAYHARIGR